MNIEKISNGYLVCDGVNKSSYPDIQRLFEYLLLNLEGRGEHFGGSCYGKVSVDLKDPRK